MPNSSWWQSSVTLTPKFSRDLEKTIWFWLLVIHGPGCRSSGADHLYWCCNSGTGSNNELILMTRVTCKQDGWRGSIYIYITNMHHNGSFGQWPVTSAQWPVTSDSPPLLQELVTPLLCADGDVSSVQFCNIDINTVVNCKSNRIDVHLWLAFSINVLKAVFRLIKYSFSSTHTSTKTVRCQN